MSPYQANDAGPLQELWEHWQHSPDNVSGAGIGADLIRLIRQIAQVHARIGEVDAELERLQAGELCRLLRKAEAAAADGLDLLHALAADVDGQIEQKRTQLDALLNEFVQRKRLLMTTGPENPLALRQPTQLALQQTALVQRGLELADTWSGTSRCTRRGEKVLPIWQKIGIEMIRIPEPVISLWAATRREIPWCKTMSYHNTSCTYLSFASLLYQ